VATIDRPAGRLAAASRAGPLRRLLYDARVRGTLWQVGLVLAVGWVVWWLAQNLQVNLERQRIATGFGYLARPASFEIGETLIRFEATDSYARVLLVGVLNTVYVSILANLIATALGLVVGILRLSPNPLLARLMLWYVEILRNVPLLLQLFFWYSVVLLLPPVRESLQPLPHVYLSNGGLFVPTLHWSAGLLTCLAAAPLGLLLSLPLARRRREAALAAGRAPRTWPLTLALVLAPPLVLGLLLRPDVAVDLPTLGTFRISGGATLSPEFTALLVGLSLATSASIAEIVRSGIQAVPKGQWEAAGSLGLHRGLAMRLVVLPQALRVMIPPLTSTYLSTTKNSSLAVAIGYPDLVSVSNTTMNQTGQAIEAIAIFMGIYLALSLTTSAFMNWYNARVALVTR
jgi:general L-amino acid transport system permease protein